MGILDFVPRKPVWTPSSETRDSARDITIKCDHCKKSFKGFKWMLKSRRMVLCPDCWKNDRQDIN